MSGGRSEGWYCGPRRMYNDLGPQRDQRGRPPPPPTQPQLQQRDLHTAPFFECGGRDLERRRREAVDGLINLAKPTRMRVLLGVREMVKDSMVQDPDMSEGTQNTLRRVVDIIWKDLLLFVEFQSLASVQNGRALVDYEENAQLGKASYFRWSPEAFRASFLYLYLPFDKSIHGKMKTPAYWLLLLLGWMPFFGVRMLFFSFVFLLHMAGDPPDTYQVMHFVLEFKNAQFKGGLLMLAVAFLQYVACVRPGDASACTQNGPGMVVPIWDSLADMLGSALIVAVAFLCLPATEVHRGAFAEQEQAEGRQLPEEDQAALQEAHEEDAEEAAIGRSCLPCCRTHGMRRMFVVVLYDLVTLFLSLALFAWTAYLDVALIVAQDEEGGAVNNQHFRVYMGTRQANAAAYRARAMYSLLAAPFVALSAPALSIAIALTRWTGYNRNGYCVPFTLRPPRVKATTWRACDGGRDVC